MSKAPLSPAKASLAASRPDRKASARPATDDMSVVETAQFIAEFTAELAYLARQSKLDLLTYLLDMARLEAIRAIQADQRNPDV